METPGELNVWLIPVSSPPTPPWTLRVARQGGDAGTPHRAEPITPRAALPEQREPQIKSAVGRAGLSSKPGPG